MKIILTKISIGLLIMTLFSCNKIAEMTQRAANINHYEKVSLNLAKDNRLLSSKIEQLKFEIQKMKSENEFLTLQIDKKKGSRKIASVNVVDQGNDLVKFNTYKWKPSEILAVAEDEFQKSNFEKSAQFFQTFVSNFPLDNRVNEDLLFQTGIAAYESGQHHDWVINNFSKLLTTYPASKYYRGAKLWMALTHLKQGKKNKFFDVVEEFRKKYRNTSEWKILSAHYEKIVQKYKM